MRNYIKYLSLTIALLLGFWANLSAQEKKHEHINPANHIASIAKPSTPKEIFHVEETSPLTEEIAEESTFPSGDLYQVWINKDVNPYKIDIKDLGDSIQIPCTGYIHPIDNLGHITSEYGPRRGRFHYGIDLKVLVGDDIYAVFDGKVRVTGFDRYGYGYYVVIRHENGLETLYGHLSKIKVEANQDVKAGDLIGLGGSTGRSTGSHLHLEFRYLGNAINPKQFIDFDHNTVCHENYTLYKDVSFKEIKDYKQNVGQAKYHVVKSGDSLSKIAVRYGTSVNKLCKLNGITTKTVLRPNRKLRYA